MSGTNGYTKTQLKMLAVLSDGMPHSKEELHACLPDELSSLEAVETHLCYIRRHLRPKGQDIICEFIRRQRKYRHVQLLPRNDE